MNRILIPGVLAAILAYGAPAMAQQKSAPVEVWKSATCGCCIAWIKYMQSEGYTVKANNAAMGILAKIKRQAGLSPDIQACHTAKIAGYVIEGHVPARDIARLLSEKPDAIGLAVPNMPMGSPGMDFGPDKQRYEVLLVKNDGSTEVFTRY